MDSQTYIRIFAANCEHKQRRRLFVYDVVAKEAPSLNCLFGNVNGNIYYPFRISY